jgi:hypothetical protein
MNGAYGHGHDVMGDGGGPGGGGGSHPTTGGVVTGHASQGSFLASRRGLGVIRGGCGGPGGGGNATERARASSRLEKTLFSSSALTMTATAS